MALLRVPEKMAGMKLPEYRRIFGSVTGTGRTARADDAFARRIGAAEKEGWQAAGRFAEKTAKAADTMADDEELQAARAAGAYNSFQIGMKEKLYGEQGLFRREGEEAFSAPADADRAVRESMEEAAEEAHLDGSARTLLAKQVFAYHASLMPEAQQYADTRRARWLDSQNQTGMDLAREGFLSGGTLQSRMMYLNDMQENHRRMAKRHGLGEKERAADWEKLRSALYDELKRQN